MSGTRRALLLLIGLAWLTLGLRAAQARQHRGRNTAKPDAAVVADARPDGSDLAPSLTAIPSLAELAELDNEIAALHTLLHGALPETYELGQLFEVDLSDEEAIKGRVAFLQEREGTWPDTGSAASPGLRIDGGAPPPDARTDALSAAARLVELDGLRAARDRLRLAFLRLPRATQLGLLDADRTRVQIRKEQAAARAARSDSENAERQAEQERAKALGVARLATEDSTRAIANERARIEANRAMLAAMRGDLVDERIQVAKAARADLDQEADLLAEMRRLAPGNEATIPLYERIVHLLMQRSDALEKSLGRLQGEGRTLPTYRPQIDLDDPELAGQAALADLRTAIEQASLEASKVAVEEEALAMEQAVGLAAGVRRLNQIRLELLSALPEERRDVLLGFGPEGLDQLFRELHELDLAVRVALLEGGYRAHRAWAAFKWSEVGWPVAKLALLLLLYLSIRRRSLAQLARTGTAAIARLRNRGMRMVLQRWLAFALALAPDLLRLGLVYVLFWLFEQQLGQGIGVLGTMIKGYAWYRVILSLAFNILASAVAMHLVDLSERIRARLLRTVRTMGRTVLFLAVWRILSAQLLGKGYLYNLAVDFGWVLAIAVVLLLIRRWREDITNSYLEIYPSGRLAELVRRTRHRLPGFFVTVAAFGYVAVRGLTIYARELLLRFSQIRRALAYLLGRRLEKSTKSSSEEEAQLDRLPEEIRDVFTEGPPPARVVIPHFPGLDEVSTVITRFQRGEPGRATLLTAERGMGKSTWLAELAGRIAGPDLVQGSFSQRELKREAVCRTLASWLSLPSCETTEQLVAAIRRSERRIVLVDEAQHLFLRAPQGLGGISTLTEVIGRTSAQVQWVVACSYFAWRFLATALREPDPFVNKIELSGWDELELTTLIDKRMAEVKHAASWDDLMSEQARGPARAAELRRARERYFRLVWDHSDGAPRVAVRLWLRSLHLRDRSLQVELFAIPKAAELERLSEPSRSLLAALLLHDTLTVEEAARVLHLGLAPTESLVQDLDSRGYLVNLDGRRSVNAFWHREVLRYLRRKHALPV